MSSFLKYASICIILLCPFWSVLNAQTHIVKDRIVSQLLAPSIEKTEISDLLQSQHQDGTWAGIDYTDVSRTGFEHRFHLAKMVALARAYKIKGSPYFKDKKVVLAIEKGLKHWVDNDYICDNWWHNQIGTPNALVSLMLLVGEDLDASLVEKAQPMIARAHVEAPGARPGGDRIKIAGIQAKNLLFLGESEKFNEIVRVIESEIKFSEWVGAPYGYGYKNIPTGFSNREMGGRGIMHDYSFHHRVDGVNNTLSYGLGYAAAFVEWVVYTSGTTFSFSEERLATLIDYFLDGICKTAVFGKFPDANAKNRSISRVGALKPYSASLAQKLLQTSDYRTEELQEIVDIRNKGIKPTRSHATYYWHTEHFSFQRPNWFTSVRMYSTRTHNMEQPYNSEGLFNHHRGDGANHISRTGSEYLDIWPVYDYQKIPGTTVMQKEKMPEPREIQKLGITDFVGAATDGKYGSVAFDFRSPHDPLIARKSWFFFDEEYVCLGAGISCKNRENPVITTLNQCHLKGDLSFSSSEETSNLKGGLGKYGQVNWVYHDSTAYIFPNPTDIHLKAGEEKGSWWRINKQTDSPKDEVNLKIFKLWLDHGIRPSEESYEYIVVPAISKEKFGERVSNQTIQILSNTPELQAVSHTDLNILQAVFYQAGEIEIGQGMWMRSETPGIVMLKQLSQGGISLTVSDPNRELGSMHLVISQKFEKTGDNYHAYWNENEKQSHVIIELPKGQYAGSSVTIGL